MGWGIKSRISLITVIVLVFLAICFAGCSEIKEDTTDIKEEIKASPEDTLEKYVEALNTKNLTALYNLQSSDSQNKTSRVDFYNSMSLNQMDYLEIIEYQDYSEEIVGNNAYIATKIIYKIDDEFLEQYPGNQYIESPLNGTMTLENGEWRMNFFRGDE